MKNNKRYLLRGRKPVGVNYSVCRTEIAEYKNGNWYKIGSNKKLCNFIIESKEPI